MRLSYDACWQTAARLFRAHVEILLIITGVFMLLPLMAQMIYLPPPALTSLDPAGIQAFLSYYEDNVFPVLLVRLAMIAGTGCLFALMLARDVPTVGDAIRRAALMLPPLVLAEILTQILIVFGLIALILPGLYIIARVALVTPVIVIEKVRKPDLGAATELCPHARAGLANFWADCGHHDCRLDWVFGDFDGSGVLFQLILPQSAVPIARALLGALSPAALTLIFSVVSASIYHQITTLKGTS